MRNDPERASDLPGVLELVNDKATIRIQICCPWSLEFFPLNHTTHLSFTPDKKQNTKLRIGVCVYGGGIYLDNSEKYKLFYFENEICDNTC